MSLALHIVAACTERKRGVPLPQHRLRSHSRGPKRATNWFRALHDESAQAVRAADLYVGNHWAVVRDLPTVADAKRWQTTAWVASAGYGLVPTEAELVPYSATFAPGHSDSVIDPDDTAGAHMQASEWWAALAAQRARRAKVASLPSAIRRNRKASILVIASRAYIEAISGELLEALKLLEKPTRLVIVTSGLPKRAELHSNVVDVPAKVRGVLGGPLTALHARFARDLIEAVPASRWSVEAARARAEALLAGAPDDVTPIRTPMTDAAVRRFVRGHLRRDPKVTPSRLLRTLRAEGRACEQKRFKNLFLEVKESSWSAKAS